MSKIKYYLFFIELFISSHAFSQNTYHEEGKSFGYSTRLSVLGVNNQEYLRYCKTLPSSASDAEKARCSAALALQNDKAIDEAKRLESFRDVNTLPSNANDRINDCFSNKEQSGDITKEFECEAIRVVKGDNPSQKVRDAHPDILTNQHHGAEISIGHINKQDGEYYKGTYSDCRPESVEISPARYSKFSCGEQRPTAQSNCIYTKSETECEQHYSEFCEYRQYLECLAMSEDDDPPKRCIRNLVAYVCITSMAWEEDDYCGPLKATQGCKRTTTIDPLHCDSGEFIKHHCYQRSIHYGCLEENAQVDQIKNCDTRTFKTPNNTTYDAITPSSVKSLMQVATTMEAAREAGVYTPDRITFFKGELKSCSRTPLKNCCKRTGGTKAQTNRNVLGPVLAAGAGYIGGKAFDMASKYVYDFMFESGIFSDFAFNRLSDLAAKAALNANFQSIGSIYGVTLWSGSASAIPSSTASFFGQTYTVQGMQIGSTGFTVGFDPWSLALSLAIQVIVDMATCEHAEKMLAKRYEAGLCIKFSERCTKRIPIIRVCIEWKTPHCCYNSKLARSIQEQAGRPSDSSCPGFTPTEFEAIDFNKLDLRVMLEAWNIQEHPLRSLDTSADKAMMEGNVNSLFKQGNFRGAPVFRAEPVK